MEEQKIFHPSKPKFVPVRKNLPIFRICACSR